MQENFPKEEAYRVIIDCAVRKDISTTSELICNLKEGTEVIVTHTQGRRARIRHPWKGWCSLTKANGERILESMEDIRLRKKGAILFKTEEELTRVAAEVGKYAEDAYEWPQGWGSTIFNIILSFRSKHHLQISAWYPFGKYVYNEKHVLKILTSISESVRYHYFYKSASIHFTDGSVEKVNLEYLDKGFGIAGELIERFAFVNHTTSCRRAEYDERKSMEAVPQEDKEVWVKWRSTKRSIYGENRGILPWEEE